LVDYYAVSLAAKTGGQHRRAARFNDGENRGRFLAKPSDAPEADAVAALKRVGTDASECSEVVARGKGDPCSSRRVLQAIKEFADRNDDERNGASSAFWPALPSALTSEAQAVRRAAQVLGCSSESCVVTHPKFRSFVQAEGAGLENAGGAHLLDIELDRRFKTEGPRGSTRLLSNFNIDGVLQEWAAVFPEFFNYSFNMIDFEAVGGSLARTDVVGILEGRETQNLGRLGGAVQRPCSTFGCVLNTDVSTGRGKHWVALFGDCRGKGEWTVEYFNSAGNPPPDPVTRWLESSAARLTEYRAAHPRRFGTGAVRPIPLTDVRHQNSMTECGLYALFYIRRRLEGAPLSEFQGSRILDSAMVGFRKHVFREK